MSTITAAKARQQLAEILNQVAYGKERMVLTRRGKKLAAVVPIEDLEALERLENKLDLEDARQALADAKKRGTVPWETVKKKRKLNK